MARVLSLLRKSGNVIEIKLPGTLQDLDNIRVYQYNPGLSITLQLQRHNYARNHPGIYKVTKLP